MPVVSLDAKLVREAACPPGKAKIDFYSDVIPGWVLEVRKTGGKTWYIRFRNKHSALRQFKIGDADSVSFDKSRLAAQTLRSRIVLGEDPAEDRKVLRTVPRLSEVITDRYIPLIERTRRNFQSSLSFLKLHVQPQFGKFRIDELTTEMIADAHLDLRGKGYALAMCNKLPITLMTIYRMCQRLKVPGAESNPAKGVKLFEPNNARDRYLTKEETQRLLDAVQHSENPQLKYLIPLYILLSCRREELLQAKWCDFDLDRRIWRIPMSKNGRPRLVPVPQKAIDILQQLPRWNNVPWLIPSVKTKKPMVSFFHAWKNARKLAGLSDVRIHDLRRTGATNLWESGADLLTVSKVLGHRSLKYVQVYSVASDERLLSAVDKAANAVGTEWLAPQKSSAVA